MYVLRRLSETPFLVRRKKALRTLQQRWTWIICLLCTILLILIIGTLGAYCVWRQQQVLLFGGAVAAPLLSVLLVALRKFRW